MSVRFDKIGRIAVHLEMRWHGQIWQRDGLNIFVILDPTGRITNRALIFLKDPPPSSNEDGIEITPEMSFKAIDKLIEANIERRKTTR
jgi:hypothetical protein